MLRIGSIIKLLISFILMLIWASNNNVCIAQNNEESVYNHYTDTLIIIGDLVIDKDKIYINREELLESDTLKVNQRGFLVKSFKVQALALGANITLSSDSGAITTEMKNELLNDKVKYKFIYIKDLLLQSGDGRTVVPTTTSVKVVFKN